MTSVEEIFFDVHQKTKIYPLEKSWSLPIISILILRHITLLIIKIYSVGLQEKATSIY